MTDRILGLHHITAIAGDAQRNYDFYTKNLGLRLVKKTVNFDDPGTYHFYFGNEQGSPGTILTFFPWAHVRPGRVGTGMATEISYSVPQDSLEFWKERLERFKTKTSELTERFGEKMLSLEDPDGLKLNLVVPSAADNRSGWTAGDITDSAAIKGFHNVVLTLRDVKPTASILTDIFGYTLLKQEGNFYRFVTDAIDTAAIVDIYEDKDGKPGINAGGTNHHVAFRVKDEATLMNYREKVSRKGYQITPKIDRNYFFSLYFREPGGVLFEIATDNPGFAIDEPVNELGLNLKLPAQYEEERSKIERMLPVLQQ